MHTHTHTHTHPVTIGFHTCAGSPPACGDCVLGACMLTVIEPNLPIITCSERMDLRQAGYLGTHLPTAPQEGNVRSRLAFPVADRSKPCISSFFFPFFSSSGLSTTPSSSDLVPARI